jgi:dihydrofolate reductase
MKISLYNAVSIDGFIAGENDNTSWVSDKDWEIFEKLVKEKKAVVMGKRTYEVSGEDFPYPCELNIVMTSDEKLLKNDNGNDSILFTNKPLKQLIKEVEAKGFKELLIIGGGRLNASFLKENLIDEIIIDIHPIILGQGIKLFEGEDVNQILQLREIEQLQGGLLLVKYNIKRD